MHLGLLVVGLLCLILVAIAVRIWPHPSTEQSGYIVDEARQLEAFRALRAQGSPTAVFLGEATRTEALLAKGPQSADQEKAFEVMRLSRDFGYSEDQYGASLALMIEMGMDGSPEPTPIVDQVMKLWESKQFERVNEVADSRLGNDEGDLLGLLIKYELAMMNLDLNNYYDFSVRILRRIANLESEHFIRLRPILVAQLEKPIPSLLTRSPEELDKFRQQARRSIESTESYVAPMTTKFVLWTLELDGHLDAGD